MIVWKRRFVMYFFFVGWDCISFGFHICVSLPNIEIHLPFGFIKIGLTKVINASPIIEDNSQNNVFGWSGEYKNKRRFYV